jgi:hypothetical protein
VGAGLGGAAAGGAAGFSYGYNSAPEVASDQERLARGVFGAAAGALLGAGAGFGIPTAARMLLARGSAGGARGSAGAKQGAGADSVGRRAYEEMQAHLKAPKGKGVLERLRELPTKLKAAATSRFIPLRYAERRLYKEAGLKPPAHDMARKFELLYGGVGAQARQDVLDFERLLRPLVKGYEREFDALLAFRATLARLDMEVQTGSLTREKALAGLEYLRTRRLTRRSKRRRTRLR